MSNTHTMNAQDLRELAKQMRHSCAPISMGITPDYLRRELNQAANLLDAVASGRGDPDKIQPSIDAVQAAFARLRAEKAGSALDRFETAIRDENPEAWREAVVDFLESLSGENLRVAMQTFLVGLQHVAKASGYVDLESVESVGGTC